MTRERCEKDIIRMLMDMRTMIKRYDPEIDLVNLSISDNYLTAFSFNRDHSEYLLNTHKRIEEVKTNGT